MIKLKNSELTRVIMGLNEIVMKELPVKTGYWLAKIAKKVSVEHKDFETQRIALLTKYSMKDEDGNPIIINNEYKLENEKRCASDINELSDIEIEIDINPIRLSDLGNINVRPVDLIALVGTAIIED